MADLLILDFAGDALDALLRALSADRASAAALLARLDQAPVAALSLGLGSSPADAQDRTVAAAFLLARTQRLAVLATVDPARHHPIHVARTVATLQALHPGRIGVIAHALPTAPGSPGPAVGYRHGGAITGGAADYLRLLSALWDGWPLDALAADSTPTQFVDAQRLQRVNDPHFPGIGGPLTLPVDGADKPPLLLAHAGPPSADGTDGAPGVDLHLHRQAQGIYTAAQPAHVQLSLGGALDHAVLAARAVRPRGHDHVHAPSLRLTLGLGASRPAGLPATPVFESATQALRV